MQPLREILGADAEKLAAELQNLPRNERARARTALWQAYQELEQPKLRKKALLTSLVAIGNLMKLLEKPLPLTVWQMRQMQPYPEVLRRTLVADRVLGWKQRYDLRWQVRMALSARRLAWWENRLGGKPPTHVATVREPEKQDRDALELLHKRGRSRFS